MEEKENRYLEMINQNQKLIYKLSSMYADKKEDQEDLAQEIYFQLWKSFDSFGEKSKLTTWLYRVGMNTAIQFLKKRSRSIKGEELNEKQVSHLAEENNPEEGVMRLRMAIRKLNELEKGIVFLYLEEKSHKEIAEIIGISVSNVGTRIQRIKQKLSTLKNK